MENIASTIAATPDEEESPCDQMNSLLKRIRALNVEVTQAFQTDPQLPTLPPRSLWHPSDPLVTERQKQLAWSYKNLGIVGLAHWTKEICVAHIELHEQAHTKPHPSWQRVIDDHALGIKSRTLYYLSTIHPELISPLISGDLPARLEEDPAFKERMHSIVDLKNTQGTYAIYAARAASQRECGTQARNPNAGLNVTLRELLELCDVIRRYIDLENPDDDLAREIDVAMRQSKCHQWADQGQRRYAGGDERLEVAHAEEWLAAIESAYLEYARGKLGTTEEHLLDIPLRRCFPYVGLATRTLQRAPEHWTHKGNESILYGLITATMEKIWPGRFVVKPYTYHLITIVREEDIGLDEIIISILTSAYGWETGLSHTLAGMQTGSKARKWDTPAKAKGSRSRSRDSAAVDYTKELRRNAKAIQESGYIDRNIKDARDKVTDSIKTLNFIQNDELPMRLKTIQAIKENNKKLADELLEFAESSKFQLDIKLLKEAFERYKAA